MFLSLRYNKAIKTIGVLTLILLLTIGTVALLSNKNTGSIAAEKEINDTDYIKWAEFNVSFEALDRALSLDINSQNTETPVDWIEILSCAAARHGGSLKSININELNEIADDLSGGKTVYEIAGEGTAKYYDYYKEVYDAVLGGFCGYYSLGKPSEDNTDFEWELRYGLKAYSPIAEGFSYSHYDDFGNSRTYGYSRPHLGNDIMGSTGTPIVAVESGTIEAIGWNQYGGWRIGIRSFDKKRYYYYAHLKEDTPYASGLKEGDTVCAGDVIGYMGRTGYSTKENVSNMQKTHLHFGMQLIFDESQKEGENELWIDTYNIVRLLDRHRSTVERDSETGEYKRVYSIRE